jgi:cytochrome c oxidase cbb3-type subunit 3
MLPRICKRSKKIIYLLSVMLLTGFTQPAWAAGPPEPSVFSNPLALTFMILMVVLLIIIGILAFLLIGTADLEMKKRKIKVTTPVAMPTMLILLLSSSTLFAQAGDTATPATTAAATSIGGLSPSTFYIMASVIFLELAIILVLLFNIRFLLKVERQKMVKPEVLTEEVKRTRLSWWDKFNKLRPVSQEAELDLGHDYDGIRELNNRLPPWWLYGFYLTIVVAVIYLWRFHVSHTGPSSIEEYETAIAKADLEVSEYLKKKGDNVDENTVTYLTSAPDIDAGKVLFANPANCVVCHREDGGGNVGPNLTDDYWITGGSIKDIFKTIKYGTTKGMRSWQDDFSSKQIAQIASYVKSLHGTNPPNPKEPAGQLYKEEAGSPAVDSIKMLNDSIKAKDNKVASN